MYIKERVWAKLQGWKEQLLSQADLEVLFIAVIQATRPMPWAVSSSQSLFAMG